MASEPNHVESEEWGPCPSGKLQGLGRKLRSKARLRQSVLPGLGCAAALVLLAGFFYTSSVLRPGGIGCEACVAQFEPFNEYLVSLEAVQPGQPAPEADATLVRVRRHLEGCRSCRESFERAYPDADLSLAAIGVSVALALIVFGVVRPRENRSSLWPTGP